MRRIAIVLIAFGSLAIVWYVPRWIIWRVSLPPPDGSNSEGEIVPGAYDRFIHLLLAVFVAVAAISIGCYLLSLSKKYGRNVV